MVPETPLYSSVPPQGHVQKDEGLMGGHKGGLAHGEGEPWLGLGR